MQFIELCYTEDMVGPVTYQISRSNEYFPSIDLILFDCVGNTASNGNVNFQIISTFSLNLTSE